jgi:hypothetical protein
MAVERHVEPVRKNRYPPFEPSEQDGQSLSDLPAIDPNRINDGVLRRRFSGT